MAEYRGGKKRKKVCQMCAGHDVKYSDYETIRKYVSADRGKILPRRMTGNCAKHQRYISIEIKKARFMAILPFVK